MTIHDTEGALTISRKWADVIKGVPKSTFHNNKSIDEYGKILTVKLMALFPKMSVMVGVERENILDISTSMTGYTINDYENIIGECIQTIETDGNFWIKKGGK